MRFTAIFSSSNLRSFLQPCVIAIAVSLVAIPTHAHVALDVPNGGETLEPGSTFTILWHDTIAHGPANYDLWYSTSGPAGPWVEVANDLTFSEGAAYSFDWAVPDTPSDQVRLRVLQDNTGTDYDDISDADFSIAAPPAGETVVLEAAKDTTLYEGDGSLANGSGSFLFTGKTEDQNNAAERRGLLAFDFSGAIPAGATITAVSLELTMSRTISGNLTVGLHRVLEDWAEGPSDPGGQEGGGTTSGTGDSTWLHRNFPNTLWSTEGGSFSQSASSSAQVADLGAYTFSSTASMIADAQEWLDDPQSNYGWAIVGSSPPSGSAKRFNSREHETASSRPRLFVMYEANTQSPTADFSYNPSTPRVGQAVQFEDLSSGSPTNWLWNFGDGQNSEEGNPVHFYDGAGTFSVSLTASNANGNDTSAMEIAVLPDDGPVLDQLVFLPAAANISGEGSSFFVTTADVHNSGTASVMYRLLWLPRNTNNSDPITSGIFTLEPGSSRRFENLLLDAFGLETGAGAVAVQSNSADIEIVSRTFNQGLEGTFGQSLPGVPADQLVPAGTRARILFLTENTDFRSNLGLFNGTQSALTVQWELFDSSGNSLTTGSRNLPPYGNFQLNRALQDFAPIEAAYADIWTSTSGGAITCYGSVLDEVSSDPTTILPF